MKRRHRPRTDPIEQNCDDTFGPLEIGLMTSEAINYDRLDSKIRWAIANGPCAVEELGIMTPDLVNEQHARGADNLLKALLRRYNKEYPKFKWPDGAPW